MGGFGGGPGGPARRPGAKRSYDYDIDAEEVSEDADSDPRLPPTSE
jgi:hypothetical protein